MDIAVPRLNQMFPKHYRFQRQFPKCQKTQICYPKQEREIGGNGGKTLERRRELTTTFSMSLALLKLIIFVWYDGC